MKLGDALTVIEEQLSNAAMVASSQRDLDSGARAHGGIAARIKVGDGDGEHEARLL